MKSKNDVIMLSFKLLLAKSGFSYPSSPCFSTLNWVASMFHFGAQCHYGPSPTCTTFSSCVMAVKQLPWSDVSGADLFILVLTHPHQSLSILISIQSFILPSTLQYCGLTFVATFAHPFSFVSGQVPKIKGERWRHRRGHGLGFKAHRRWLGCDLWRR